MWTPPGPFLEIGCNNGRSTSVLAAVAKAQGRHLILIDPYLEDPHANLRMIQNLARFDVGYSFHHLKSSDFGPDEFRGSAFFHIDGDHSLAGVSWDAAMARACVVPGGYAAFHDYGVIKDVRPVADEAMKDWLAVSLVGRLAIFQRRT